MHSVIRRLSLAAMVVALLTVLAPSVSALECEGIALDGGCLFTITGGDTDDPDDGFAVTNADDVPLWDFVRARDLQAIGYPISQRWTDGPFTLQAFQKVILQWEPGQQRMNYYNTLDVLANRYPAVELPFVPAHQVLAADQGMDFGTVTRNHLALLDQNAAIKERFLSAPDWLNLYGLPIRYEEREVEGHPQGVQMLRAQRTVFVVWNVPAPGTTVGRVNLQNVPDQVKQLSNVIIPAAAKVPVAGVAAAVGALGTPEGAPWPTSCVALSDMVEGHRGNGHKVGNYQRVFGEQAEGACQLDHREHVSRTFAWALAESTPPGPGTESSTSDASPAAGGWPATCVALHDIVASHLGNDGNVGLYQRTFGEQAEAACRQDRADDVRTIFGWAVPCDTRPTAATSDTLPATFHDLAQVESSVRMVLVRLPWLACQVYPWLADGVSGHDFQSLESLMTLAPINESFAMEVASYPWFTDGVDPHREAEWGALRDLTTIAEHYPVLLSAIRELSWITDERPDPTSHALFSLTRLAESSVELAILAATSPWMTDGVAHYEAGGMGALRRTGQARPIADETALGLHPYPHRYRDRCPSDRHDRGNAPRLPPAVSASGAATLVPRWPRRHRTRVHRWDTRFCVGGILPESRSSILSIANNHTADFWSNHAVGVRLPAVARGRGRTGACRRGRARARAVHGDSIPHGYYYCSVYSSESFGSWCVILPWTFQPYLHFSGSLSQN